MKKSSKIVLTVLLSLIVAGVTVFYVNRPETYIKIHFPNAEVLSVEHRPGAFMFDKSYIRYTLYDTVNEFRFFQDFTEDLLPQPYNNAYGYNEFMEKKQQYDIFLAEIADLYNDEYFTRYDLNMTGLFIFLKESIYEDLRNLITGLNALDNKIEYVLYSLPSDVYEQMLDQDFKKLSAMEVTEPYHSYCLKLIEMFLGLNSEFFCVSDEATSEVFDYSDTMIVRSGYEGTKGVEGLIYSKNFKDK